jgi:hypothetical protein
VFASVTIDAIGLGKVGMSCKENSSNKLLIVALSGTEGASEVLNI